MIHITHYTKEDFLSIRTLLHIAVEEYSTYHDEYIAVIVRDAQLLIKDNDYRYRANKRVYRYSSFISKRARPLITSMNPNHLTKEDYIKLLSLFEEL